MAKKSDMARGKDGTIRRVLKEELRGCKEECDWEKSENEKGWVWEICRFVCVHLLSSTDISHGGLFFFYDAPLESPELSPSLPLSFYLFVCVSPPLPPPLSHTCAPTPGMPESVELLIRVAGVPGLLRAEQVCAYLNLSSAQVRKTKQTGVSLLE